MVSYKGLNTARESIVTNICYTIWNINADEGITIFKSMISYIFHTVGNIIVSFFCSIRNKSGFIFIK